MDLKTRAVRSAGWFVVTRAWQQAVSWVVTIALARLLAPADYGLFGMALAVIGFLEMFQQMGLGVVIVQRQGLTRRQVDAIFWVVAGSGLAIAALVFLAAPLALFVYGEPRVVPLVRALTAIYLLNALGTVPYGLLTREIDFRRRSLAEASGILASAGVSIGLAWLGHGVWALVGGQLVRAAVRNGLMVALSGWRPSLDASFEGMRDLLGFGGRVAGATVTRELASVTNAAIVGRFLGTAGLGHYSMAQSLGINPFHKLSTAVVTQLALPVFAKLQGDDAGLRRYFLAVTRYLAVIAFPVQLGLAMVAPDAVILLLSEKWRPIVGPVQFFCLTNLWYLVALPAGPALTARGRARLDLRWSLTTFAISTAAHLVGAQFGLLAVVVAASVSYCALRSYFVRLVLRELGLSAAAYLESLRPALAAALVMVTALWLVRAGLPTLDGALERLVRDVAVGAAAYGLALLALDRRFGSELRGVAAALLAGSRA